MTEAVTTDGHPGGCKLWPRKATRGPGRTSRRQDDLGGACMSSPKLRAFILADHVYEDGLSRKYSILGAYDHVGAPAYPYEVQNLAVYLELGGECPSFTFALQLVKDGEREPLFFFPKEADGLAPLAVRKWTFNHGPVLIPAPGAYRLQLLVNGDLFAERLIRFHPREGHDG